MTIKKTKTIVEEQEITQAELDSALYLFLYPEKASRVTDARKEKAERIVKEAYKNGYRLKM